MQALVNGATIRQEFPDRITYFHAELARHEILPAEGVLAESYPDSGNRGNFEGEAGAPIASGSVTGDPG